MEGMMKYTGIAPAERICQAARSATETLEGWDDWSEDVLEKVADGLAIQCAYVRDQLNNKPAPWVRDGRQRSAGTVTRRVRKALGYTNA